MIEADRDSKKRINNRLIFIDRILDALYETPDLGNVSDPLEELIYLTITQRTRINTAMRIYSELKNEFPDMDRILDASENKLRKILSPGGRGNLRVRAVKEILAYVKEKNGKLSLEFLRNFEEERALEYLLQIPWVGEKIAKCVMLYSLGFGVFPADSNVIRIFTRMGVLDPLIGSLDGIEHRKAQSLISGYIPPDISRSLHVNMVVHGQEVCKPGNPGCSECEIRRWCKYFREVTVKEQKNYEFSIVDIFSGAGGLSYGFITEGYRVLLAVDNDNNAHETFLTNNPGVEEERVLNSDITTLKTESIKNKVGDTKVDVLVAGIPCQGFSMVGYRTKPELMKKNGYSPNTDPRNQLYKEVLRFVDMVNPEFILIENVPGINTLKLKHRNRDRAVISLLESRLRKRSYDFRAFELDTRIFGIPQRRKRIFCIAWNSGEFPENIIDELKSVAVELGHDGEERTLKNAIADLPRLRPDDGVSARKVNPAHENSDNYYMDYVSTNGQIIYNHVSRYHNEDDMKIIRSIRKGENYKKLVSRLPSVIEGRTRKTYTTSNFPDKFFRLAWNYPSRTIVSHLAKDGNSFIHPSQNRSITVREAARIQTFPDDYIFMGSRFSQFIQVGNAVPPLLARIFGRYFRKLMENLYGNNKTGEKSI